MTAVEARNCYSFPSAKSSSTSLINPRFLPIVEIWHLRTSPGKSRLSREHCARNSPPAPWQSCRFRSFPASEQNSEPYRARQNLLPAFEAADLPAPVALPVHRPHQFVTESARGDPACPPGLGRVVSGNSLVAGIDARRQSVVFLPGLLYRHPGQRPVLSPAAAVLQRAVKHNWHQLLFCPGSLFAAGTAAN